MLEINNLKFSQNGEEIFSGVDLEVRLNSFIGLSGEGVGLLPENILGFKKFDNGTTLFENKKVSYRHKSHLSNFRKGVGYIPSEDYFLVKKSLFQNLLWLSRSYKDEVLQIVKRVGLEDKIDYSIHQLSEYDKFWAKVGIALLQNPYILFINDTINIKKDTLIQSLHKIEQFSKESSFGVLFTTEREELLKNEIFSNRYRLEGGQIVSFYSP
jgi:putative amino-acid transport system ATP-binding protein